MSLDERSLAKRARRGFSWSLTNSVIRRLWTFAFGLVLARVLQPADFGVFAIALASLTVLLSMNDLGVGVAIIRWQGDPSRPSRTATTISIGGSVVMYLMAFAAAPVIGDLLGNPAATPVLRLITLAVVFDGVSGIPNALLERAFLQRRRLFVDIAGMIANGLLALGLAFAGFGPFALAWGILAGNFVTAIGIILVAPARPYPGYRARDAKALLAIGLPLAGASLLVFAMLNVDYFVIGGLLDAEALGFYLLAFNLSSWTPNLLTTAIRSVSIPAFSQLARSPERLYARFTEIFGVVMTLALPVGALLAILAGRVIGVLYGTKWLPAGQALVVLAALGVIRIGLDLCYDLFVAIGMSRTVLWLQGLWVAVLIPAMLVGARTGGIRGAAIAHVVVAVFVVAPAFALALRSAGVPLTPLAEVLRRPFLATAAMVGTVLVVDRMLESDLLALIVGGVTGAALYGVAVLHWRGGRPDLAGTLHAFRGPVADGES